MWGLHRSTLFYVCFTMFYHIGTEAMLIHGVTCGFAQPPTLYIYIYIIYIMQWDILLITDLRSANKLIYARIRY